MWNLKTLEGLLAEFVFGSKLCSNSKKKEHILVNSSVTVTLSHVHFPTSAWDRSRKCLHKTASLLRSLYVCTQHSTIISSRGLSKHGSSSSLPLIDPSLIALRGNIKTIYPLLTLRPLLSFRCLHMSHTMRSRHVFLKRRRRCGRPSHSNSMTFWNYNSLSSLCLSFMRTYIHTSESSHGSSLSNSIPGYSVFEQGSTEIDTFNHRRGIHKEAPYYNQKVKKVIQATVNSWYLSIMVHAYIHHHFNLGSSSITRQCHLSFCFGKYKGLLWQSVSSIWLYVFYLFYTHQLMFNQKKNFTRWTRSLHYTRNFQRSPLEPVDLPPPNRTSLLATTTSADISHLVS